MSTAILPIIQTYLIRYGTTTLLVLGCFGNAYVVFLFVRHRKNACALFLLSAAVMNIVYLAVSIPLNVYITEYSGPSLHSMAVCKLRFYLFHVWGQMSRYFILLACIDRFALTHMTAGIRLFSRPQMARRLIIITTVFWHLFAVHILVMTTIANKRCGYFDLYSTLNSIYALIFVCLLPPVGMGIFGYWALRNMKQLHSRVQPTGTAKPNIVIHRQDRNSPVMVIAKVIVYVVP